jgi:hypothetical protein
MSQHVWRRAARFAISTAVLIAPLTISGVDVTALAGPAENAGLSLVNRLNTPILLVKDKVHKPKNGCLLCNDKGYCLDSNSKENCQTEKSVIEKTWGPDYKWRCICSRKPAQPAKEGACCWPADNPGAKSCGEAKSARNSAVISNPGKAIECGPYN